MLRDRDKSGGDVALYVHKSPDVTLRQDLMDCNFEPVSVQVKVGHYRPFLSHLYIDLQGNLLVIFKALKKYYQPLRLIERRPFIWGIQIVIFWINQTVM